MSGFAPLAGQLPATATNDNASAGKAGEYAESIILVGAAVSLTTGTNANITSLSLTAGDWDVDGAVFILPAAATATAFNASVSLTSATQETPPNQGSRLINRGTFPTGGSTGGPVGTRRLSLNATTTVYLVLNADFGGTCSGYGALRARRVR